MPAKVVRGAQVLTAGGEKLGEVAEIVRDAFRVDVEGEDDYWLPLRCVSVADEADVYVEGSGADLERLREEALSLVPAERRARRARPR